MTFVFNLINMIICNILSCIAIAEEMKDAKVMGWELQFNIRKGIIRGLMIALNDARGEYARAYAAECARTPTEWHNTPRMKKHWAQLCDIDKQVAALHDRIAALDD